jgi:hypothetical protein
VLGASGSHLNPRYSEGRDQEDRGSKLAHANMLLDPISKIPFSRKGWWSGSRCRPWVQTSVLKRKKEKKKKTVHVSDRCNFFFRPLYILGKHSTTELHPQLFKYFHSAVGWQLKHMNFLKTLHLVESMDAEPVDTKDWLCN